MRIKTNLFLLSTIFVISIIGIGLVMFHTFLRTNALIGWNNRASGLIKDVFELNIITYEYVLHYEERMREQWVLKYDLLGESLGSLERGFLGTKECRQARETMNKDYEALGALFSELGAVSAKRKRLREAGGPYSEIELTLILEERHVAQVLMRSQEITAEAFGLSAMINDAIARAQQRANLAVVFSVVGFAIFSGCMSFFTVRAITGPISELTRGAAIIGKGDLTHRVDIKGRNEISVLATAFNEMTERRQRAEEELYRLNARKSRFLSTVSHEFRTPLVVIRNFCDILAKKMLGEVNEEQRRRLRAAVKHADYLGNLVSNLLDLHKIEAGDGKREVTTLPLERPVEQSVASLLSLAEEKEIELRVEIDKNLPAVLGNEEKLLQILNNLLSNAIKFTPGKGRVTIRAKEVGDRVEVDVADSGIGIPSEHLSKIFEEFHRVPTIEARAGWGAGLGLTIVKYLLEEQGGDIRVTSELGKGSTFSFSLRKGVSRE